MANTINVNSLTVDSTYLVRGKSAFCRITRQTTDAEREAANKTRQHPIEKNYTTISIYDAQVLCKDPNKPSLEEQYAAEKLYRSSSPDQPGNNFTAMNKSHNLPKVAVADPNNPNSYDEIIPEGELARGVDVTLVMRVFKGQGNNGVSLDRVLVNEPIRYFGGSSSVDKSLSEMGITFNALSPAEAAKAAPVAAAPDAVPFPNPEPAVQTAPPAADNPFSANPFSANPAANAAPNNEPPKFGPGAARQY